MRYVGGKHRIARWIGEQVRPIIDGRTCYLEPFVGSAAVFSVLAPSFRSRTASDSHPDLILMLRAIGDGWDPPAHVSREEYVRLRSEPPSALRGLVGFGSSFGGKWFGGYVDTVFDKHHQRQTKPYLAAARASLLKIADLLASSRIKRADYRKHSVDRRHLVYCDPPYAGGVLGYGEKFDTEEFWDVAGTWRKRGATVVVSESAAPRGWRELARRQRKHMLRATKLVEQEQRDEVLWI